MRRRNYLARLAARQSWNEKVIGYMIDFGGGWREEDDIKTKCSKFWEIFICGLALSCVPLAILGVQ